MLHDVDQPLVSAARRDMTAQAAYVAAGLKQAGLATPPDREIVALIAYLQRLGTDIKAAPAAETTASAALAPASGGPR
jgi:cytochrome c oxidase cbb3-type subunit I/II